MRGRDCSAALFAVCMAVCLIVARVASAATPPGFVEAVLQIQINASTMSEMVVGLRDSEKNVWVDAEDLKRLRLQAPNREPLVVDGVRYFPLQAIAGATIEIDETTQVVELTVPASAFLSTSIALSDEPSLVPPRANLGGFLNYDLSGERDDFGAGAVDASTSFITAFTELGIFGPFGVVTNSAIGQRFEDRQRAIRLETTWTYDFPEKLQTIRVGDAISSSSQWSRAARFGGVQWGSNFAVRPDLVTSPLLAAAGEAVVPSTVDVFINNQQITSQQVPAGPFVIDRLPAVSGAGDVRLVVRDAFGREQVITSPFYSSPVLLREGLAQYSVEVGKIRENFALASSDYGPMLVSGTYRRGLTSRLTLETHGEFEQSGPHAAGVNAAVQLGGFGVVSGTLAYGADSHDSGVLTGLSYERSGKRFSVSARSDFASDGFREVGDSQQLIRPTQQHSLRTGANFGKVGSFSLAYAMASFKDEPRREVGTFFYNVAVGGVGYLGLSVSHTWSTQASTNAYLSLTVPLGTSRSASVSARMDKGELLDEREVIATFQQSPPVGKGNGYRLSASSAGNYSGSWISQFDVAAVQLEAAKYLETRAIRASVSGAAVEIGGDFFATRSVLDSFALVDLNRIPDIDIMVDNQVVRRTNDEGRALIRNLRAYENNRLSIDPRQLPLDVRIDTDKMTVSPRFRSGLIVKFPVVNERAGTFKLKLPNGQPVPTGAEVIFKGNRFPVALDGFVYVTGLDHGMSAEAEWNGGHCAFRVGAPIGNDPLPDMGTIVCRTPGQ